MRIKAKTDSTGYPGSQYMSLVSQRPGKEFAKNKPDDPKKLGNHHKRTMERVNPGLSGIEILIIHKIRGFEYKRVKQQQNCRE